MSTHRRFKNGQYRLYAYVCGSACVVTSDVDGTVSFWQVFMKRPVECRYAIVGEWDIEAHCERVLVWDLDDTKQSSCGKILPPPPLRVCEDADQAIMATLMLESE